MTALGGHINHVYEDWDLRFRDIKQIFRNLGFADIDVYEKLDGQNLFIGWNFDDDCLKVARNKQNVKDGGLNRYGLSLKFGDRPKVEKLFLEAYDVLSKAIGPLNHSLKSQIFGSMGSIWFPIEIINPDLPNTIVYNGKYIVFHEYHPVLFSFDGEPISKGLPRNMEMLKQAIPFMNENLQEWFIKGPNCFALKPIDESIIQKSCDVIDQIRKKSGLADGSTIREHLANRLRSDMQRFPMVPETVRAGLAKSIVKMPGARQTKDLLSMLDQHARSYAKQMIDEEKKNVLPKILASIESTIHKFSSALISHMHSDYIQDIKAESQRIKKEYDRCCDFIRNGTNEKYILLLNDMESKIGSGVVTMEGFVFEYNNKIFKVTGAFTPINRIIATIRYAGNKRVTNKTNDPISSFIQGG